MAYFLGYNDSGYYKPLDLKIENQNDILSIVNFTCDFPDEESLKEKLYEDQIITNSNITLTYLIDKGHRGYKEYLPLPNINRIYFSEHSSSFDAAKIKNYLNFHWNDKILFTSILASYLKKIGFEQALKKFLENNSRDHLLNVLKHLYTKSYNYEFNSYLQKLICSFSNGEIIDINKLCSYIVNNNEALVITYRELENKLYLPKTSESGILLFIISLINQPNPQEYKIKNNINMYLNNNIIPSNLNKVSSRNLVDLGSIIQDYKDYLLSIDVKRYSSSNDDDYDDDCEFLEEDDFARYNTSSEEAGIRLRHDSSWSKY
jgi:hypothetical protein